MASFRHVLVPVDLSTRSVRLLAEGRRIAEAARARLSLIHVASLGADADTREDCLARLSHLAETVAAPYPVRLDLIQGEPTEEILAFAADHDADLVVLGTHTRGPLDRLLVHSIGEVVVRRAAASVLAVGDSLALLGTPVAPSRILCATDFTQGSEAAVRIAADLARAARARLTVLHVLDGGRNRSASDAYERLAALVTTRGLADLGPDTLVSSGLIPHQIVGAASAVDADLLVVGARTRRLLGRVLIGAVARDVLALARRPVLLARPGVADRREPAVAGELVATH